MPDARCKLRAHSSMFVAFMGGMLLCAAPHVTKLKTAVVLRSESPRIYVPTPQFEGYAP